MYCLVTRCKVSPGSQDEIARIWKEEVEPLLSSNPGFQGFGCLIKPDGEALVMGLWDSEERANARLQRRCYKKVLARLQTISVDTLIHQGYEVPEMQLSRPTESIIAKSESSFDQYFRRFTGQTLNSWYRSKQKLHEQTR